MRPQSPFDGGHRIVHDGEIRGGPEALPCMPGGMAVAA
jgi:hypothetical protein